MNLAEISKLTRKSVIILGLLILVYLFGFWIRTPIGNIYDALFPPKDLPTVSFGVLPQLQFTAASAVLSNPTYTLNTRDGRLPADLPNKMTVFKYILPRFSYSAGEKAQQDAQRLGFTDDMRVSDLSSSIFQWQDVVFGGNLVINITNETIDLSTPMGGKGALFPSNKLTRILAIDTAIDLLKDLGRWDDELYTSNVSGYQEVTFGKFGSNSLIAANSTLDAQIAKVDFYREIGEYPILGPNASESLLSVVLREPGSSELYPQLSFPRASMRVWHIDTNSNATYPLIPVSLAWEQVAQNNGILSSFVPSNKNPFEPSIPVNINEILINEIYLAYYDNYTPQTYLQPIYVFEGNYRDERGGQGSIFIYYPAVSGEYVQSTQTQP